MASARKQKGTSKHPCGPAGRSCIAEILEESGYHSPCREGCGEERKEVPSISFHTTGGEEQLCGNECQEGQGEKPPPRLQSEAFKEISLLLESFSSNMDETHKMPLCRSPGKEARTSPGGGYSVCECRKGDESFEGTECQQHGQKKQVFIAENPAGNSLTAN